MEVKTANQIKGGEFLVREPEVAEVFSPEDFSEEQKMIAGMTKDFLDAEVLSRLDEIDDQKEGLMVELLDKAGSQGLLGLSLPEEYGGFGKDVNTSTLVTEVIGAAHSFAVALAAHTGIGTMPILYFGNEEQKKKYLPRLATGEWKACYCLTEPGSGSDALAAKTKAVLSADKKHYILNGQKMWITNAGFADVFVVFAKIDGEKFTGFIVERTFEGLTVGEEEHKMGIKGSSTRQVFFTDCKVPAENLLGEAGKGHLIAFNILNMGRLKLAAAALGAAKRVSDLSISYAGERVQFNIPIAKFGAIRHKLAEQAIRIFAAESAIYRVSNLIQEKESKLEADGRNFTAAKMGAAEEYAIECAILKVMGSEMLDYVTDEGVQIYGGYGFSADYPMERSYRDSRINRIFEGTNEINRLLIPDMLFKRAMKGELDLTTPAMNVQKELTSIPDFSAGDENGLYAAERKALAGFKKAALMIAGAAVQKFMMELAKEQEILMYIADLAIDIFTAESLLLRTEKIRMKGTREAEIYEDILRVYFHDISGKINLAGKDAISAFAEGDEKRMMMLGLKRFTKYEPVNTKDARRRIAAKLVTTNRYSL